MNSQKLLQQFHAMFGVFMVMFFLGFGTFFLFFADRWFAIDKAMRVIMGSTFLFYGVYRAFVAYKQIREAFFTRDDDEE
ncbi:MAG: hypothetical protein NT092_04555 [Bacteroidia bacterium]|nr:hypothetical protein [Bacteroidia bacterium]